MTPRIFISGTGTNVGKTLISSWLSLHLKADYFKPIQTGGLLGMDSQTVMQLSGAKIHKETYVYEDAVSPHLASKSQIDLDQIKLPASSRLIVEGAGGLLVPINKKFFMIDLIKALNLPVILVASSLLGTINHTLLSLEALAMRNIKVLGIIVNGEPNQDNCDALEFYGRTKVLAQIPQLNVINKSVLATIEIPQILQQSLNEYAI